MEFVRAVFAFEASQAGDLSFEEDEVIAVKEKNTNGWWTGQIGSRVGDFPFNYVEPISMEEARAHFAATMGGGGTQVQGDRLNKVVVQPVPKVLKFQVEATLNSGSSVSATKDLADFRKLDAIVKAIFPSFEANLPPMWADNAYFDEESTERRSKSLQSYLRKYNGNEVKEGALLRWLKPNGNFNISSVVAAEIDKGMKQANAVSRESFRGAMKKAPALARVAYNWVPHDAVELELRKGEVIAVLSRQTLSPGWWEGQTAEGLKGLFPYNHVELLEQDDAANLVLGKYAEKLVAVEAKPIPKEEKKEKLRPRKTETDFAIKSTESYDALMSDGFTMELNGEPITTNPENPPQRGDHCKMTYVGYVWDCQAQQIVEFASSDLPGKDGKIAKLEFTLGNSEVIKGIELAAEFMDKGQSCRLIVKPEFAYGDVGFPQLNIPPSVHLVYDLTLDDFETDIPGPPKAKAQAVQQDDEAIPRTLAEAIALQAKRQAAKPQTFQPIQNRAGRGHGNNLKGYKKEQVAPAPPVGGGIGGPSPTPVKKGKKKGKAKGNGKPQYSLHKMREIVRTKAWDEHQVDAAFLEESLTDAAFDEAFRCDRSAFILMPRWKQMKMKRDAQLY